MIRHTLAAVRPLVFLLSLVMVDPAGAASKIAIAALGDAAPGGGVFAGPSFVGEPGAGGAGWVAFRAQVTEGSTTEQIVVGNLATGGAPAVVASVGQTVSDTIGRVKQFLGRPSVNARGDVAFAAVITPPDDAPRDPLAPTPAGVFLWSGGKLSVVAAPGLDTGFSILDLTTPVNVLSSESGIDIAERTPALNDAGDVAFVASTFSRSGGGGAIFLRRAGQALVAALQLGAAYGDGTFQILGPPALNNAGTLAFRGLVDGATFLDGVFTLAGGVLSLLVRDGDIPVTLSPATIEVDLFEFGDVVALNDAGDVVCTGSSIFDASDDASLGDPDGSSGVILIRAGAPPLLVGFPGQRVELFTDEPGRVFDLTLGPEEGSRTAAPSLTADGKVIFFAQLNNGSSQAILRVEPAAGTLRAVVRLGGAIADATPVGGTYQAASSAPAVDAVGNVVFSARIEGATTGEALVWQPPSASAQAISIGDAVPEPASGFFGGPAFFPPLVNDAGDVVFKSYVARGPALGIFRFRDGALTPLVRVRDAAPVEDAPPFSNLAGEPSMNAAGEVAFAAVVQGRSRGIFVTSGGTVRKVAMPLDDLVPADPKRPGAFIKTIAANPSLNDSGAVVFRGVVQFESRLGLLFPDERQNCVFLADESGVHVIAAQGDESGTGRPFLAFRDPTIAGPAVLFRAPVGDVIEEGVGLFLRDGLGVRPVAVEGQDLGGMSLDTLQGKGLFDAAGDVFFSAKVRLPAGSSGAIVRGTPRGFETVVQTNTLGPEGGRIRSLGRPSISSDGRVALRLGFDPLSGGVPGLFLARDGVLRSYLRIGEGAAAGLDGRITSLNQNVSVNSTERLAFLGSIGGGRSRSAIMLAAPTALRLQQLTFRRGPGSLGTNASPKPRDRVRFSVVLEPGFLPLSPAGGSTEEVKRARRKAVTLAVADSRGTLWTGTLPSTDTRMQGRTLVKKGAASGTEIAALRAQFTRTGSVRVTARSRPFDLSFSAQGLRRFDEDGTVILEPPFSVRVDVGEDGGSVVVPCAATGRRFRCGG